MHRLFGIVLSAVAAGLVTASPAKAQVGFGIGVGRPGFGYPYGGGYGVYGGYPGYGYAPAVVAPAIVAPNVTYFQSGFYNPYVAVGRPQVYPYGYGYGYGYAPRYGYPAPRVYGYGPRAYRGGMYVR